VPTKLTGALRRELAIGGNPYVLTITAEGFKLVPKGKRKGRELAWHDLVSGEAALAVALNASLQQDSPPVRRPPPRALQSPPAGRSKPGR
jgi:hypothetical protein